MQSTQNESMFSEISAEESATVNGGNYRCDSHYGRRNVYYSPSRYYGEESYRHHAYGHRRSSNGFGIVVRYNY